MNAITKQQPETDNAPVEYAASLMDVIARAASDPNVDIDKMERLIALQERVEIRNAEVAFAEAFAEMQPELPIITMNGQIVHKGAVISEFSDWANINKAITPILKQFGFGLSFKQTKASAPNLVAVTAFLRHRKGHTDEGAVEGPNDTSGAKNAAQSVGSSLSYYKRYGGVLILNLTIEGEDDDGATAAPKMQVAAPRDLPFPQGPARNKSDLKTQARAVWRDIESCTDLGSFNTLLTENHALLEQMKEALPEWWTGGQNKGEAFEGLEHVVERVRRDLNAAEAAYDNVSAG